MDDSKLSYSDESEDEEQYDKSCYIMLHHATTAAPCLSFDIMTDNLGNNRSNFFPLTTFMVAGTQSPRAADNNILLMKMHNLHKIKQEKDEDDDEESSDDDNEEDEDEKEPKLATSLISHPGCVNRIRGTTIQDRPVVATWSEMGKAYIWDLTSHMQAVISEQGLDGKPKHEQPLYSYDNMGIEGYGLAWSPLLAGVLAIGDCNKDIRIIKPTEAGNWSYSHPFIGHTDSVEDIQWSPNEDNVLASCSVDKSIRIWDARVNPQKANMVSVPNAHESDVNVISWNPSEPLILSGGDDGKIKVWDLRMLQEKPLVGLFSFHEGYITSVDWHPTDGTVFAASGSDNKVTIWDMALEPDTENGVEPMDSESMDPDVPHQLLFIHEGQKEIKEISWHKQMPGVIISSAQDGFNIFRTISE